MTATRDGDLPEMLLAILQAARSMFPGQDWDEVEHHVRRAWNDVSHEATASWQDIRTRARREWEAFD
jgi:hypothetical protein